MGEYFLPKLEFSNTNWSCSSAERFPSPLLICSLYEVKASGSAAPPALKWRWWARAVFLMIVASERSRRVRETESIGWNISNSHIFPRSHFWAQICTFLCICDNFKCNRTKLNKTLLTGSTLLQVTAYTASLMSADIDGVMNESHMIWKGIRFKMKVLRLWIKL